MYWRFQQFYFYRGQKWLLLTVIGLALLFQIDTDKLFNNISEISNANCEFWKCHLVKVLEESRSTASLLNPSVMKEGFKKVRFSLKPCEINF